MNAGTLLHKLFQAAGKKPGRRVRRKRKLTVSLKEELLIYTTASEKTMGDDSLQGGLQMPQHQDIAMSKVIARPATLMVLCNVHTYGNVTQAYAATSLQVIRTRKNSLRVMHSSPFNLPLWQALLLMQEHMGMDAGLPEHSQRSRM